MADTYLYSPYGVLLASTGSDANPFRYGGQAGYYADSNNLTQTVLCGLRWYSPSLGRWLSRDPLGYAGGANLYEYCGSNPISRLDPTGMDAIVYIFYGDKSGGIGDKMMNSIFGTHAMIALQTPGGDYITASYAGALEVRRLSDKDFKPIDINDPSTFYKDNPASFAIRMKNTNVEDEAMLKHLISLTGEKLSVKDFLQKLGKQRDGALTYSDFQHQYGSFNVITNNCSTFVANMLRSGGERIYTNHPNAFKMLLTPGLQELHPYSGGLTFRFEVFPTK